MNLSISKLRSKRLPHRYTVRCGSMRPCEFLMATHKPESREWQASFAAATAAALMVMARENGPRE